jgi:hypothetical protein
MAKVLIASKLPNGIKLKHPTKPGVEVEIRGLNSAARGANGVPIVVPFVTTEVDEEFWELWYAAHNHATKPFGPLKGGAIFLAKSEAAAGARMKEEKERKTGFEPLKPTDHGMKPLDDKE